MTSRRLLYAAVTLCTLAAPASAVFFQDVSRAAGLDYSRGKWLKYGGAAVADLDGDGCPDLLLTHHGAGRQPELYFNKCDGTFSKKALRIYADIHGLTPIRLNARDARMHFLVTSGGARGNDPQGSRLFAVTWNRAVVEVTRQRGLGRLFQRGRTALSVDLAPPWLVKKRKNAGGRDLLITSASIGGVSTAKAAFRTTYSGYLKRGTLSGDFAKEQDVHYVLPVDARNDGVVRILALTRLHVFEPTARFRLSDISKKVLPPKFANGALKGITAAAEADFHNDGLWDVYLARSSKGSVKWFARNNKEFRNFDVLLRGTYSGTFKDASKYAKIPTNTDTSGITTGDFDNDGYVDILLIMFEGPDVFLINNGDGTFSWRKANWRKIGNAAGDMATAVDYDGDGRLDLVISEGDWFDQKKMGFFRIMKNITPFFKPNSAKGVGNYLLVRVGSSKSWRASSLYAVVRVRAGRLKMMRRVGTPGAAVSVSYIETVHFGIARNALVNFVQVTWTDGSKEVRRNIKANHLLKIGRFS